MSKISISRINQVTAGEIGIIALGVFLLFVGIGIFGAAAAGKSDSETAEAPAEEEEVVQEHKPKYTLEDPIYNIEETVTSDVTEESDTKKSNRLEDIMDVLSDAVEEK